MDEPDDDFAEPARAPRARRSRRNGSSSEAAAPATARNLPVADDRADDFAERAPAPRSSRSRRDGPLAEAAGPATARDLPAVDEPDDDFAEPAPAPRARRSRSDGASSDAPARSGRSPRAAAPLTQDGPLPDAFEVLGVDELGLNALASMGFTAPTPIQERAIPLLLEGRDVVGLAQTGTGKTLAFGLPLARSIDPDQNAVQAVILIPTRELATQVTDVLDFLGRYYGFATIRLMGGTSVKGDLTALDRGGHVIVGTPGRVIDHLKRGTLTLDKVRFVVLDEADEMLDIGFAKDIDYILRTVPRERQTALFSATMPMSISRLVWRYMRESERIETSVAHEHKPAENVRQLFCEVAERDKFRALRFLHEEDDLGRSLIFRRTRAGVDNLAEQLRRAGFNARPIHGDLRQSDRDRVMREFRAGTLDFLVATNVAARGLDIPDIAHVVNYDVPQNVEEYIHRVGRTARAGKTGSAITLVGEWELGEWDNILDTVGADQVEQVSLPSRW